jgi:nucleoside 2-deoxyribosyltransferase
MKIYLAGPINGCTDEECKDWRQVVKSWCKEHFGWDFTCIDPMARDYRGVEDAEYREIVDLDKRDILKADVLLVNYLKPSVGTSMEVFYAWTIGKPIIVIAAEGTRISPWLRYHSTTIVNSFETAIKKLQFYA